MRDRTDVAGRRLAWWLRSTGILYAMGGAAFLTRPQDAVESLSRFGEPLEPETTGVYHALAGAYMATIAALALAGSSDEDARDHVIPPLLVAKAGSAGALLYRYLRTRKAGFAAAAALDALLLGVTAGLHGATRD